VDTVIEMWAKLREHAKGWRTIIVNAALGLPSLLYTLYLALNGVDFTPVIPAQYVAVFALFWSLLGIGLRLITTGPAGSKGDVAPAPETKAGD
jgi:hypothetical protein